MSLMRGSVFLQGLERVLSARLLPLAMLNWLFFGSIVAGAFLKNADFIPNLNPYSVGILNGTVASPLLFLSIFLVNLGVSGLLLLTLSGFVFFFVPPIVLSLRALIWGALLNGLSTSLLWLTFPVLILEGEAYALMGLSGITLGLSWVKPKWLFKEEVHDRDWDVKLALEESVHVNVLAIMLLAVAAAIETIIIMFV